MTQLVELLAGAEWLGHLPFYLLIGAVTGLAAGMFGIGGGLIIVPAMVLMLSLDGVSPTVVPHLAVGSALACIVVTALSASWVHHSKGSLRWPLLWRMLPGLVLGAAAGALTAHMIDGSILQLLLGGCLGLVALQMWFPWQPLIQRAAPGRWVLGLAGSLVGWLSALLGIAGGVLLVPFLSVYQVPLRQAIGTAAACGLPIALFGALGHAVSGWGNPQVPAGSSGFVYWPAVFSIVLSSVFLARTGARLAHRLPVQQLRRWLALLLIAVSGMLLWDALRRVVGF